MHKVNFERIFLHCSDSEFGTALMINSWHIQKGFRCCGYNEVINSGYPSNDWYKKGLIIPYLEGSVEEGRIVDSDMWFEPFEQGAGVKGWNLKSFHICMIGKKHFSNKVLNSTLIVMRYRLNQFGLGPEAVLGHYEKDLDKTCPNIDMIEFRKKLIFDENYGDKIISVPKEQSSRSLKFFNIFLNFFKSLFNNRG